jgi:predicted O-methyltransferase YrrM
MDRPKLNFTLNSVKEAIRILNKNPMALINYIEKGTTYSVDQQIYQLCDFLNWNQWGVGQYLSQIRSNRDFQNILKLRLGEVNYGQMVCPELLYVIVRKLCPDKVVETGVSAGVSSAYILQALEDNQNGYLYSIDLPNTAIIEAQKVERSGFVIPEYLHNRWTLWLGSSQELLRTLLKEVGHIDMFLHDSEHSYNNMQWEYETAWMSMNDGGLIMSHDINDNSAFHDFSKCVKRKYFEIFFTGVGIIKK